MPYYIEDLKRDPNIENYPFEVQLSACQLKGSGGFGVGGSVAVGFIGLGLWFCASLRLLVSAYGS